MEGIAITMAWTDSVYLMSASIATSLVNWVLLTFRNAAPITVNERAAACPIGITGMWSISFEAANASVLEFAVVSIFSSVCVSSSVFESLGPSASRLLPIFSQESVKIEAIFFCRNYYIARREVEVAINHEKVEKSVM
jgi:hypothetical protein